MMTFILTLFVLSSQIKIGRANNFQNFTETENPTKSSRVEMEKGGHFLLACHGPSSQFTWSFEVSNENNETIKNWRRYISKLHGCGVRTEWDKNYKLRENGKCTEQLDLTQFQNLFQLAQKGENGPIILIRCSNEEKAQKYASFFKCGHNPAEWLQVHSTNMSWTKVTCDSMELAVDQDGHCRCRTSMSSFFDPQFQTCCGNISTCENSLFQKYSEKRFRGILNDSCNGTKFNESKLTIANPGLIICQNSLKFYYVPFLPKHWANGKDQSEGMELLTVENSINETYKKYLRLNSWNNGRQNIEIYTGTNGTLICSGPRFLFSTLPRYSLKWFVDRSNGNGTSLEPLKANFVTPQMAYENIASTLFIKQGQFNHPVQIICRAFVNRMRTMKDHFIHVDQVFSILVANPTVDTSIHCAHLRDRGSHHHLEFICENKYGAHLTWFTDQGQDLCNEIPASVNFGYNCSQEGALKFLKNECPAQNLTCIGTTRDGAKAFSTISFKECTQFLEKENSCSTTKDFSESLIIIGVSCAALTIVMTCMMFLFQKLRAKNDDLSDYHIEEFMNGGENPGTENVAFFLPYNSQLEIPLENIEFDSKILGSGQFGLVTKGSVEGQKVAIKSLKPGTDLTHFKSHLSELKIMSFVGRHENIVQLVGASTVGIKKRNVYLIYEFCSNGNLLDYVKKRRDIFVNQLENDEYKTVDSATFYENATTNKLCSQDLIRWSMEISCGMEYVASLKIYHGDLACRNILLGDDLIAKVGDFGLSKQLQAQYAIYVQTKECPLPLKWLALESLRDLEFSIQSDVWSFGICMWELFSLGSVPYPEVLEFNFSAWTYLNNGNRMARPEAASNRIYEIMLKCWNASPKDRPSFMDLKEMLQSQLKYFNS